jgi:hypothetical protein
MFVEFLLLPSSTVTLAKHWNRLYVGGGHSIAIVTSFFLVANENEKVLP